MTENRPIDEWDLNLLLEQYERFVKELKQSGLEDEQIEEALKREFEDWELVEIKYACDERKINVLSKPIKLSQLSANLIGRKVRFEALLIGDIVGKAIERKILVKCRKCGNTLKEIDLKNEDNFVFAHKVLLKKLRVEDIPHDWDNDCISNDGVHKPFIELSNEETIDYSILFVKELPENVDVKSEEEYRKLATKVWKVYYFGIPQDIKRAKIYGYVVKNPSTNEIEIIAYKIKPAEEEFANLKITKEDHEKFRQYFGNNNLEEIKENQIAPHIVGRSFEKLSLLLTLHSPYRIYDIFNSRLIRGCLRGIWIGDTKTGKSETGKDVTFAHYKLGEMIFAEMSSRAGLTYTIDSDKKTIIWGTLPMNDRKFLFIDGLQRFPADEIGELREALEQEIVKVTRSVSGERLARVRIIATLNPPEPENMNSFTYKILALKNSRPFHRPADLTRWDFVIPFCEDDVSDEEIAKAKPKERPIPDDIFRKHVLWVWSLEPENIRYSENAKERIIQYTEKLLEFSKSPYPLIHRGIRDVLTRISVAFACLKHSFIEEKGYVEVKEEHVEEAYNFLMEMIQRIEYDSYVIATRDERELKPNEFERIISELEERHIQILKALELGVKKSPDLASQLGVSVPTIKRDYEVLRKYNLIKTSPKGVQLTRKGIQFVKILRGSYKGSSIMVSNSDTAEQSMVSKNDTMIPQTTQLPKKKFVFIEPYYGRCSYCGEMKELRWRDEEGNHLCDDCKREMENG